MADEPIGSRPADRTSIDVTLRTDRSPMMFLAQHIMKPLKSVLVTLPKALPAGSPSLDPEKSVLKECDVDERQVDDIRIYDVSAKRAHSSSKPPAVAKYAKRIYYFAGGGWRAPPTDEHWKVFAQLATRVPETAISVVSYPLAPHSAAPVAFPQLLRLYRTLMRDAEKAEERIIFVGDSAGGNIILALTLHALNEEPDSPCPSTLLAIAPSTDLSRGNPDIVRLERHDPLLRVDFIRDTAASWRAEWDSHDPRVSPLFADLSVLARRGVKVHGVTGGYDMLSPDGILFRDKCQEAGISGEWLHWEKQMHCFFLAFPFKLKESVAALEWIISVLQRS